MIGRNDKPIWTPSVDALKKSQIVAFMDFASKHTGRHLFDWSTLYAWSIQEADDFWETLAAFVEIKWQSPPQREKPVICVRGPTMRETKWFPGTKLNFAENLLPVPNHREVLIAIAEGTDRAVWTGLQLWNDVARCAAALKKIGVGPGDRVAGVLVNSAEAVIAMLATTSLGGIWSSCSPDFGARGIADRLGQVQPRVVFVTASYGYSGKEIPIKDDTWSALQTLPSSPKIIPVDHRRRGHDEFADFLQTSLLAVVSSTPLPIQFAPRNFDDPVYILFSSGTTGLPKCITHGVGGTLLQHQKELRLHSDLKLDDGLLFYTTCGWMMWNWMVSALGAKAKVVLFDGAPAYPNVDALWNVCRAEGVTHFGTSPKFVSLCSQNSLFSPITRAPLPQLRMILSTGSPLLPAHYEWIYQHFPNIHLASISGGTDIVSCFMLGNPMLPVYAGEIQAPGLGMAIEAWDDSYDSVTETKGELVCVKPFVAMPVSFWNDQDGARYHDAYFGFYPGRDVWRHGDFIEVTKHGGIIVYGRSDATLNPGGIRIGTAELYRVVESLDFVVDSIAIGQITGDDTRVVLFVKIQENLNWDDSLEQKIKAKIRAELTPRHVPAVILPVKDIPYTRSGKKVEIAVTQTIHGEEVPNRDALAQPEVLKEFQMLRNRLLV